MLKRNHLNLLAAGLLSGSLIAGCSTMDEGFANENVDSTLAPLIGADDADAIPGDYIVVFKDSVGTSSINAAMNRVALRGTESRVTRAFSVISGFAGSLDAATLDELRRNPDVAYIEQDKVVRINTIFDSPADGIDRTDQRTGHDGSYNDYGRDGSGVHIYIVDTGIRTTHNEFTGRTGNGATSISDGRGVEDCNGHGSHVASTTAGTQFGMAKAATLHPVRVLDCNGSGTISGVISGVDFVRTDCPNQNGPCVANMSLGGGASQSLDDAVANAVASGVTFAVAAGNESQDACNVSPAREPAAITVAAIDDNDGRASFSNFGSCVDIFAPGVSILGADIGSDSDTQSISGTSMASPHVAGAAAQFLGANPSASPAQVQDALEASASLNCVSSASGSPNVLLFNDFSQGNHDCGGGGGDPGDDPNSCEGFCGGQAPGGCFCDSLCSFFGDCCSDKVAVCG